jgi:hypothetical protein
VAKTETLDAVRRAGGLSGVTWGATSQPIGKDLGNHGQDVGSA